ncbi:M48 family metallopeptidase [Flavobacterium sp.]|uniref:M48 family metallopeptidase n=2 Tax=Flavobacterium sp. TaxID=239 RepID=UPI0040472D2E
MITMSEHSINYGSKSIKFHLDFSERKTLGIKVHPDNSVHVAAPFDSEMDKIEAKVKQKARWIIKQQNEFLSYLPKLAERKFINGETHLYLGRQYLLEINPCKKNEVKISRNKLIVNHIVKSKPESVLEKWYIEKAELHFKKLIHEVLPLFNKYQVITPTIQIKKMKKRWGSCSANGNIILNLELIKASKGSIEYVIIHELCHLIHHNHTKAFYELLDSIMPDWKKWKNKLEQQL